MENITITHHEGFNELVAPQGLYITEAGEVEIRTFSTRRTALPGAVIAAWRVATAEEKTQHETINIYAAQ